MDVNVSVICPVYNVEKYLEKAVQSIQGQKYQSYEIILVDDGSTDKSGHMCDEYARAYHNIRVVHQKNQGPGTARNNGLKEAKGKYIYFMDPDDYIDSALLAENIKLLEENSADFVMFNYIREVYDAEEKIVHTEEGVVSLQGVWTNAQMKEHFLKYFTENVPSAYFVWNKIYRKTFLTKNHILFSEIPMGEDTNFNLDIYSKNYQSVYNPKIYYHYCSRSSSAVNRYHPDRFEYELLLADRIRELIGKLGKSSDKNYIDLMYFYYFRALDFETHNILRKECMLNFRQKKDRLKKILENQRIRDSLWNLSVIRGQTKPGRLKIYLLRRRMTGICVLLMSVL